MSYRTLCHTGFLLTALALAGCRGSVSTDLSVDAPADPRIASVDVDVAGVEFQRSDGGTQKLEFTTSERVDLIALLDDDSLRLFTDEELSDGSYSGVRLLLDDNDDATVSLTTGGNFPVRLAEGNYVAVSFNVEKDKSSNRSLVLTLDLRHSLSFDDGSDEYTLKPVLRAVDTSDAGRVSGNINVTCPPGTSLSQGGAVYAFKGNDVVPDDIDGVSAEPYATAAVRLGTGGSANYSVRFLPPDDYTLALTCNGHLDQAASSDNVEFLRPANIRIDTNAITHDIIN